MFYCGIDVAKCKHAVVILDERGNIQKPVFTVENTQAGMQFLLEQLKPFEQEIRIALEDTGHYWLSLYDALTREGYEVPYLQVLISWKPTFNPSRRNSTNLVGTTKSIQTRWKDGRNVLI